jgi:outer membrane protein insertion porin family
MKRLAAACLLAGLASAAFGQETIEKIEILGNMRVTREAVMYYLSAREGGFFDEGALRKDFRVLWSTGFFSNIRIESEPGDRGRIVKITVAENPVIKDITFQTGKRLKEDDIVNKLKEQDRHILPYSYYNPAKVQRVRTTIAALLAEKGLASGEITAELAKRGPNEVSLTFQIKEGDRARVGEVIFEGSPGLHRDALAGAMKDNKKHDLLTWVAGKDAFKDNKLDHDLDAIKTKLQASGYMEATVGAPRISDKVRRNIFFKKLSMKSITIPVRAGERYTVGDVTVEGNKLLAARKLRSVIKLKEGEWYSSKVREKAVEDVVEIYRNFGHIYVQVMPVESLDPVHKRVGVVFNVSEGEAAYLHRLEFKGNVFTKDKVLRREMMVREGDRFSLAMFKDSVLRLKQLGLVDVDKDPDIKPGAEDPTQVDVWIGVKELQRNNLQFSAGYSGYEGTFVAGSYSTVNLLGTGESLELMAQYGKRVKNYSIGFTEPYAFDLPVSLGFTVFNRYIYYPYLFTQQSRGANISSGFRVKGFWRSNVTYGYEFIDVGPTDSDDDETTGAYYNPYYYGGAYGYGKYHVGSVSTAIYRSTVDSPLTPTSGTLYLVGLKVAGGPLGGEVAYIKPQFAWTFYHGLIGRSVLGLHLNYEFIKPIGSSSVPFWERFYLGGERSVRGYEIYSVGPLTSDGINKGGEKSFVFNAEYSIPVAGPLNTIFFFDAGNAFSRHQKVSLGDLYTSAGLEFKLFVPALRVPFRLIFAYNNRLVRAETSHFALRFGIGTTF